MNNIGTTAKWLTPALALGVVFAIAAISAFASAWILGRMRMPAPEHESNLAKSPTS